MSKLLKAIFIFPIRVYQKLISPLLGPSCRFEPTCSAYAVDAINEWGVIRGMWLGIKRIFRCHPWGDFGEDPVPVNPRKKE